MGWFDDQIKERKLMDDEVYSDSFAQMANAVVGGKTGLILQDDTIVVQETIDEILKYFHAKSVEVPEDITDPIKQIDYILRPNGIMKRPVKLTPGWHKDAVGPMLGYLKEDESLVAFIPEGNDYRYFDSKANKYGDINSRNEKDFGEDAYVFYKPFPLRSMNIVDFLKYMVDSIDFKDIICYAISILAVTLINKALPRLNSVLFGNVIEQESLTLLKSVGVFIIAVTISSALVNTIKQIWMGKMQTKLDINVRAATMMRVLSLPPSFFKKYSSGELSSRINNASTLNEMIMSAVVDTGLTSLFSLLYIGSVESYAPELLKPSVIILLCTAAFSVISTFVSMNLEKKTMEISSKESGMAYALITGIQKIKLSGAEKRAFARWGNLYADLVKHKYKIEFFGTKNTAIPLAINLIGTIVLYTSALSSEISVADYFAFTTAFGLVSGAFSGITSIAQKAATIKPVLDMVEPIFETAPEVSENKQILTKVSGAFEYNNVSFRYDDNSPWVIDDFSLKVKSNEYIAIVGKTGCGKSTLVRLLLGFETPNKGAIYVDGRNLKTVDLQSWRRQIGVVLQDGKLFQGDIYSNITISAPWLTMDEAWEAAEIAGIADDIRAMPMGMYTLISEGAGGISGGQKQRLMIARAIAPKPKILVFDEATSALDNITQKNVSESLDSLKCTRIVIAHRLSTIKHCDRIICLDGGRVIEEGTYDELIAKDGFFAELVARQRINQDS